MGYIDSLQDSKDTNLSLAVDESDEAEDDPDEDDAESDELLSECRRFRLSSSGVFRSLLSEVGGRGLRDLARVRAWSSKVTTAGGGGGAERRDSRNPASRSIPEPSPNTRPPNVEAEVEEAGRSAAAGPRGLRARP